MSATVACTIDRRRTSVPPVVIFCLHLLVLASLVRRGTCADPITITGAAVNPLNVTPATIVPPEKTGATAEIATTKSSHTAHTIAPPLPTAGMLCAGKYQTDEYDLNELASADFWNLQLQGECIDSFDEPYSCTFSFAFCKQLPKYMVQGTGGVGASQVSSKPGSQPVILGGLSQIIQNKDDQGHQLLIRFRHGDISKTCQDGQNLQVEMHLHCDPNVIWLTPQHGTPGPMPKATLLSWNKATCTYTVESQYDGACSTKYVSISAGTVIIIVFFGIVVFYLIGGVIFNKMAGAKGLELIPNYDMWTMFPSDVMGGIVFLWHVITCRGVGLKPQVYDEL